MRKKASVTVEPELLIEEVTAMKVEKVGILGGTFNPPHLGHLIIADQVKDQLSLDRVLFMPTAQPPHSSSEKQTIAAKWRVEMLDLAILDHPDFALELYEVEKGGVNYTYDTMKALVELYPGVEFYFIIGGDMIDDLAHWHRIDDLVELVQLVGVQRSGYTRTTDYPMIMVDIPLIDISSTLIRKKVARGCSIKYLVSQNVEKYIELEGLYQDDGEKSDLYN